MASNIIFYFVDRVSYIAIYSLATTNEGIHKTELRQLTTSNSHSEGNVEESTAPLRQAIGRTCREYS